MLGSSFGAVASLSTAYRSPGTYGSRPRRVADRLSVSCGVFEPLIGPNRSMVSTFESAGMAVRFLETRDGHGWENWRDTLRDALSWICPAPRR
jgi:enterochelin esterase-like enzyme